MIIDDTANLQLQRNSLKDQVNDETINLQLQRNSLKDQIAVILREKIISGKILPSTKIVERDVATWLNVSRAPIRDALLELEKEGLLESRPNGRYVIELSRKDIEDLYRVRLVLETMAVEFAAINMNAENREQLQKALQVMRDALDRKDRDAFHQGDLNLHRTIWQQSDNPHLVKMLNYILGPIFMFIATPIKEYNIYDSHHYHEVLVENICMGNVEAAKESILQHMEDSLKKRLRLADNGK